MTTSGTTSSLAPGVTKNANGTVTYSGKGGTTTVNATTGETVSSSTPVKTNTSSGPLSGSSIPNYSTGSSGLTGNTGGTPSVGNITPLSNSNNNLLAGYGFGTGQVQIGNQKNPIAGQPDLPNMIQGTKLVPVVSSNEAKNKVNIINTTATNAQQNIDKQKEKVDLDKATKKLAYDKKLAEINAKEKPVEPVLTPEQIIAKEPTENMQKVFDLKTGAPTEIPKGTIPAGYSDKDPINRTDAEVIEDEYGNQIKKFSDGTYAIIDQTGNYTKGDARDFENTKRIKDINDKIEQVKNGAYPLTQGQEGMLDGVRSEYASLINEQRTSNADTTGATTMAVNRWGLGDQLVGTGIITGVINEGLKQIANYQSKMANDVATMTEGFNKDNLDMLNSAYQSFTDAKEKHQAQIVSLQEATKEARALADENKLNSEIVDLYASGITDPTEILKQLAIKGMVVDPIKVGNALTIFNKNVEAAKKQQQDVVNSAQAVGDFKTAQKVLQLDPNSPTFNQDLAKLQGSIRAKATQAEKDEYEINSTYSKFDKTKGSDSYVNPYQYLQMRAESTLSSSEFDNRFGHFVNPASADLVGFKQVVDNTSAEQIKQALRPMTTTPEFKAMKDEDKKDYILSQGGDPADYGL